MNQLEETLRILQNQETVIRHEINNIENRSDLSKLTGKLQIILEEKKKILDQLEVEL